MEHTREDPLKSSNCHAHMYVWPPNTHMYEWHTHNVYPCTTYINIAGSQGTASSSGFIASALLWTSSKCCYLSAQDRSYPEESPRTGYGSPTFSFALDTVLPIVASKSLRTDRKRTRGAGQANKNRGKKKLPCQISPFLWGFGRNPANGHTQRANHRRSKSWAPHSRVSSPTLVPSRVQDPPSPSTIPTYYDFPPSSCVPTKRPP